MGEKGVAGSRGPSMAWTVVFLAFAAEIIFLCLSTADRAHYVWLADAFAHGRLYVSAAALRQLTALDFAVADGRYFWPLGPLPAILLLPFVRLFGPLSQLQSLLQALVSVLVVMAAWRLAVRVSARPSEAPWFTLLFCAGSVMIGLLVVSGSYFLAQSLATLFLLWAFAERAGRARPALIGVFLAAAALSRWMALLAAAFFALDIIFARLKPLEKTRRLVWLLVPLAVAWALMAAYNWARFGSWSETGYALSVMGTGTLLDDRTRLGLFNLAYLPARLHDYFLLMPEWRRGSFYVGTWGLSAFLLMPGFLLSFRRPTADRQLWSLALLSAGLQLLPLLVYYSSGAWQFGPRYLSDLLPALYYALLLSFRGRPLSSGIKGLIVTSAVLNLVLLFAFLRSMAG